MYHVLVPDKSLRKIEKRDVNRSVRKGAACLECKRRKVACSRERPCKSCTRFKCEERCIDEGMTRQKLAPTQRLSIAVTSLNNCLAILQKLIPNTSPELLGQLSREQLLELINNSDRTRRASDVTQSSSKETADSTNTSESVESVPAFGEHDLNVLQSLMSQKPAEDGANQFIDENTAVNGHTEELESEDEDWATEYGWEEDADPSSNVADDVNSLKLSNSSSQTSYLGPCSVSAVLKVITRLGKGLFDTQMTEEFPVYHRKDSRERHVQAFLEEDDNEEDITVPGFSYSQGLKLIDAYFFHVHPSTPMIHEASFRAIYSSRQKKRASWLALLYMVLAWGSIASSEVHSMEDVKYYKAARRYLRNLDSGNLEFLQAMLLMSGHYMHYRNLPNTAAVYSGAAFKIATGLGLHRELPTSKTASTGSSKEVTASLIYRETLRRTWWTMYKMEISALFTIGRPSIFGGLIGNNGDGRGTDMVDTPQNIDDDTHLPVVGQLTAVSPLILDIQLCHILERIENMYLRTSYPTWEEVQRFDRELLTWLSNCPPYLLNSSLAPEQYKDPLICIKWQCYGARIILHRTFLLRAALSRKRLNQLGAQARMAVENCRTLAKETIDIICNDWRANKLSCWSAVWYLFQAALVPLITLFSEDRHSSPILQDSRAQIEKTLLNLNQMSQWGHTASQSASVIRHIFDTSKILPDDHNVAPSPVDLWEELFWKHNSDKDLLFQNDFMGLNWDSLGAQDIFGNL